MDGSRYNNGLAAVNNGLVSVVGKVANLAW